MKRVLSGILIFVVGLALGFFFRLNFVDKYIPAINMTNAPEVTSKSDAQSVKSEAETNVNMKVLKLSASAVEYLKAGDYKSLSSLVHPQKGVVFVPYSTVDLKTNLKFMPEEVAKFGENTQTYVWGVKDGIGSPIKLTPSQFIKEYTFNIDYSNAPQVGVNTILKTGNSLENLTVVFPEAKFVEYHFPGLDKKNEGLDWCSLKIVFEKHENNYYIVALIHSQWTI